MVPDEVASSDGAQAGATTKPATQQAPPTINAAVAVRTLSTALEAGLMPKRMPPLRRKAICLEITGACRP
ncbi:MAG: hypothetical protein ACKOTB_18480, partial [Planctomycetia bacterium]